MEVQEGLKADISVVAILSCLCKLAFILLPRGAIRLSIVVLQLHRRVVLVAACVDVRPERLLVGHRGINRSELTLILGF